MFEGIEDCKACGLWKTRKNVVKSIGPVPCKYLFIGEGPAAVENNTGKPFQGDAGRRLDILLKQANLTRENIHLGNTVCCMPSNDGKNFREPTAKEKKACRKWLDQVIAEVNPEIIVTLGGHALTAFLPKESIKASHGCVFDWNGRTLVAQYHPEATRYDKALSYTVLNDFKRITSSKPAPSSSPSWELITLPHEDALMIIDQVSRSDLIAIDIETTGLNPHTSVIVGVGLATDDQRVYFDCRAPGQESWLAHALYSTLISYKTKIAHNVGFEFKHFMKHLGPDCLNSYEDTQLLAYLLGYEHVGLKDLVLRIFDIRMTTLKEVLNSKDYSKTVDADPQRLGEYCAAGDAYQTLRLYKRLHAEIEALPRLEKLYREIELPLALVLAKMEYQGIQIDNNRLSKLEEDIKAEIVTVLSRIDAGDVNLNAPAQVAQLLINKGVVLRKKTKSKKQFSTDVKSLEQYKKHPLVKNILTYRTLSQKFLGTYIKELKELQTPDGSIHTSFNQTVTVSGRLSSSVPNLQNIPVRDEQWTKSIRSVFIPHPGLVLLDFDQEQVEFKIAAHLCNDKNMIEGFLKGEDFHSNTAKLLYGHETNFQERFGFYRYRAKTGNFANLYLAGPATLARELDISMRDAQVFVSQLREIYPGWFQFIDEATVFVQKHGYVETLFGRRRHIPGIWSKDPETFHQAVKYAVNTQVQGTSADIIKQAMVEIDRELTRTSVAMLLQVHDELVFEAQEKDVEFAVPMILKHLTPNILRVPLTAKASIGPNWGNLTPLDVSPAHEFSPEEL